MTVTWYTSSITLETVTRLCAIALVVCLLSLGAVSPAAAASEEDPVLRGDTTAGQSFADAETADHTTDGAESTDGTALTLSISPKRALVSLAFIGALLARHRGRSTQS